MADWVSWAPTVVTIIIAVVSILQQNRVIRQQAEEIKHQAEQLEEQRLGQRREYVEKYYPPLVESLRHTVKDFDSNYKGLQGRYNEFFEVLIEMRDDSTLKIIESLDSELYEKCLEILDTFLPMLDDLHSQRDTTWSKIQSLWTSWMTLNFNLFPPMKVSTKEFTNGLIISSLWNFWRNEDEYARARISEACDRAFSPEIDIIEVRKMLFDEFKGICDNEWVVLRGQYSKIYLTLGDLVNQVILPRMDGSLRRLAM